MNLITLIIVIVFIVMEILNVLTLYFSPGSKTANSAGIFKAWEKSKNDPEVHDMVKYLVYWVAGTKVIFISLLIVVIILGDFLTQNVSIIALIISIATFYWKLFPLIRKMDSVISSSIIGQAMINSVLYPQELKILENRDINNLALKAK